MMVTKKRQTMDCTMRLKIYFFMNRYLSRRHFLFLGGGIRRKLAFNERLSVPGLI